MAGSLKLIKINNIHRHLQAQGHVSLVCWLMVYAPPCGALVLNSALLDYLFVGVFGWDSVSLTNTMVHCTVDVPHYSSGFIATS